MRQTVARLPTKKLFRFMVASSWLSDTAFLMTLVVDDAISAVTEVVRRCGADKSDHRHCRLLCACPSGQTAATPPSRHLLRRLQEVGEARCCARSRLMGARNASRSIETAGIHFPARRCDGVSLAAQAQQPERVRSSECCPPSIGTLSAFNRNRRPR